MDIIKLYIFVFFDNEQRTEKKETGLQLLVTAKTINYCSRQILCQTKVQQPKIEALLKFWMQTLNLWHNLRYSRGSFEIAWMRDATWWRKVIVSSPKDPIVSTAAGTKRWLCKISPIGFPLSSCGHVCHPSWAQHGYMDVGYIYIYIHTYL